MRARGAGRQARIENHILVVEATTALAFARNAGLFRLQFAIDRLDVEPFKHMRKVVVLGAPPLEKDIATLTGREIGVAWAIQWEPVLAFDGTKPARRLAPWLFA